jgi:hypothetical protein
LPHAPAQKIYKKDIGGKEVAEDIGAKDIGRRYWRRRCCDDDSLLRHHKHGNITNTFATKQSPPPYSSVPPIYSVPLIFSTARLQPAPDIRNISSTRGSFLKLVPVVRELSSRTCPPAKSRDGLVQAVARIKTQYA